MKLRAVIAMTQAFNKAYFRNKTAIFFTVLFPIVFLVIFGFIFGQSDQVSFKIELINQSQSELAQEFQTVLETSTVFELGNKSSEESLEELEVRLGRDEIDAIILLPADFGALGEKGYPEGELQLLYNQSDEQLHTTMLAILERIFEDFNTQILAIEHPLTVASQPLQTADLTRFDYVFAGLIGFSILSLGIFSMSEGFIQDKKSKALLRIKLAPVKAWQLITATILNRVLIGLISIALMFIAGILIFDFSMRGDYINFLLFSILSIICLLGFGVVIAGWAKDANQAAPLANLISFPMMFLSGVFFPVFLMPDWLQQVTAFIPLTAIVDGLRLILTENYALWNLGPQMLVILIWTCLLYFIAARTFRWE